MLLCHPCGVCRGGGATLGFRSCLSPPQATICRHFVATHPSVSCARRIRLPLPDRRRIMARESALMGLVDPLKGLV